MSETIVIVGDGAWGTVCGLMLAENGLAVRLWSAFPDAAEETNRLRENRRFLPGYKLPHAIQVTSEVKGLFDQASLAVSAVPTQFVRGVWTKLAPNLPANMPICSLAKGIETGTLLRPTQILQAVLGRQGDSPNIFALSGPSIAPEVAAHKPATVTAAAADSTLAEKVQQYFSRPYFRVYTNNDLVGVEIAGATKNVIAIAAGILDGLRSGDNAKAALLTRGLVEITRLGLAMGAKAETFVGLAGMGDLVTTCISPIGRNRSFGQAIGSGVSVADALAGTQAVVEGVATTLGVVELAARHGVDMPITQAVHQVLAGQNPSEAIKQLMTRPLKAE
jgi:glycerol-3-phosphate dehydrogenase (NAD(P)+)